MKSPLLFLVLSLAFVGCVGKHSISGAVLDRNGEPVDRAIIKLDPGNVQLVTDREGRFLIDYLRDDEGERTKLARRTAYQIEVWKPGFHTEMLTVDFKRGEIQVETITMVEDTIDVSDDGAKLDPARFGDRSHAAGAAYEGQ